MTDTLFPVTGGGAPAAPRTFPQSAATEEERSFGLTRFSTELSTDPTESIFARMCRRIRRPPTRKYKGTPTTGSRAMESTQATVAAGCRLSRMMRGMRMKAKMYPAVERTSAAIRQPSCKSSS